MMKTTTVVHLRWFLIFISVVTIDARSISVGDPVTNDEPDVLSSSYRHRLEHSPSVQTLRWIPRRLGQSDLCEFCDVVVPVVSELD